MTGIDPQHPPIQPQRVKVETPTPLWSKVVGAISIAWSVTWLFCVGSSTSIYMIGISATEAQQGEPVPEGIRLTVSDWIATAFAFGLELLLLVAGVLLIMFRPVARPMYFVYIIGSILNNTMYLIFVQDRHAKAAALVEKDPNGPWVQYYGGAIPDFIAVGVHVSFALFLLCWFITHRLERCSSA